MLVKRNKAVVGSRNEGVSNYAGEGVTCGMQFSYFFSYNVSNDCIVSGSVDAGLRRYVGLLCRVLIMTLCCDVIRDVTWHMCTEAIKEPGAASWRIRWSNSHWVRRYTCTHG